MAVVVNRQTARRIRSAHTPDYDSDEWLINPDLSAMEGISESYWKVVGDRVVEMNDEEKAGVNTVSSPGSREICVDVIEFDDTFEIIAELPGLISADIQLDVSKNRVEIRNSQPDLGLSTDGAVLTNERPPQEFHKTVSLPAPVHSDQVTAALQDGLLKVTIQKVSSATRTVSIP